MSGLYKLYFNKKILIYGLGLSGISSFNFLKKNNEVYLYDDKKKFLLNKKKFFLKKNFIYKNNFDYIVISPGININNCGLKNYIKKNFERLITDLDIFYSNYSKNKIIAITGTNGKSTTAKLLHLILKDQNRDSRLCGNIGRPILSENKINGKTIFVIETSSYQIEYSKIFKANLAIILNISPDHLERHGSMENYVNAKFKLIKNQNKKDYSFINSKDNYLKKIIKKNRIFSKIKIVNIKFFDKFKKNINNNYLLTKGNKENLSFIFSISSILKLKKKKIIETINDFKGLKFRQQIIYKNNKITCINDSKATSFASSINSINYFQKVFWIVGGIPKKGDKFILKKSECKNISVYIFGKNKKFFIKQFKNKMPFYYFNNLKDAVKKILFDIKAKSNQHKTILFSPAAASFDSFKNFEERGNYFNFLLEKYKFKQKINDIS